MRLEQNPPSIGISNIKKEKIPVAGKFLLDTAMVTTSGFGGFGRIIFDFCCFIRHVLNK